MKNMYKYALLFALAGGAALFTGCRADEEVDLAGYPETPVGSTIVAADIVVFVVMAVIGKCVAGR